MIRRRSAGLAPGYIFVSPLAYLAGPEIADDRGRPVWYRPITNGDQATDFRVQSLAGKPVLTWWQGTGHGGESHGAYYIADAAYHVIATVRAGNGLDADSHELLLTPEGTALILVYHPVPYDLSAIGGPRDGTAVEGVVQEIDVATGRVLFEWHSLDHVPVTDSYYAVRARYDYFHVNSVNPDVDGNLLISSRGTSTVLKIDRHTGRVIWRLGGKRSDFTLGPGVRFTGQHNAIAVAANTIRLFDNGHDGENRVEPESRAIWIHLDEAARTATLTNAIAHPEHVLASSQGNAQGLDNGNTFVGWGSVGRVSEFDPSGHLVFDADLNGFVTYRGYRFPWSGRPDSPPEAEARRSGRRSTTIHAVWNGATDVARWRILGGRTPKRLAPLRTVDWNGLDTAATIRARPKLVEVVAVDTAGKVLAASKPVRVR